MKEILFVDEKYYRFSLYYETAEWWKARYIIPVFKAYEKKIDKWLIYLWLLQNRPYAVVFVQLSLKNIILVKLCNILGIKSIFWQHGVFAYDKNIIRRYRKIGTTLNTLIAFSEFDVSNIKKYFKEVKVSTIIPHYEINKIIKSELQKNSILYIGQILTDEQIQKSSAIIIYDKKCEILLNKMWKYLGSQPYLVYLKKHPGDKSNYLEKLTNKYRNFQVINKHILPAVVVGHFSTLVIPYLQLGVPFVQIEHPCNKLIDFNHYSKQHKNKFILKNKVDITDFITFIENSINKANCNIHKNNFKSISETILNVVCR
jgi:hypothetical protein